MHRIHPFARTMLRLVVPLALAASIPLESASAKDATEADVAFVQKAMQANHAEVKVSDAAQTRAKNDRIKTFADRMVKDHSENNTKLEALAKSKNIAFKTEPDADHMMKIGNMAKLKDDEFDRAYAAMMVEDHGAAVALFEKAAADADDPDIKAFASTTLPALREHATMAQALPR